MTDIAVCQQTSTTMSDFIYLHCGQWCPVNLKSVLSL